MRANRFAAETDAETARADMAANTQREVVAQNIRAGECFLNLGYPVRSDSFGRAGGGNQGKSSCVIKLSEAGFCILTDGFNHEPAGFVETAAFFVQIQRSDIQLQNRFDIQDASERCGSRRNAAAFL